MRDEEFLRSKVPMTKSEVRAISLDKLQLTTKQHLLDIGAGTGSISLQATLEHPQLQVTAIESNPDALDIMQKNMTHFKTTAIELITGEAPKAIPEATYDAIFVGGSGQQLAEIIKFAHAHLGSGGRLVLNFILLENAAAAYQLLQQVGFNDIEVIDVSVKRWHALGKGHFFKPRNPTIIMSTTRED